MMAMTDDVEGTFMDGAATDTITITTKTGSGLLPSDAGINLRLQSSRDYSLATYRVRSPNNQDIAVADDLPVVTLTAPASVTQGHPFVFTVSVEPKQAFNGAVDHHQC